MIRSVYAHGNVDHKVSFWLQWSDDYHIFISLCFLAVFYALGLRRFKKISPSHSDEFFRSWRAYSYWAGLFLLFIALLSPIDIYADKLAWVHMLQHTIILMVSAPLMVLGRPAYIGQWSLSQSHWQGSLWFTKSYRFILKLSKKHKPICAWFFYSLTLWLWHIPFFYEAALANKYIHDLQHILFFVTSFFFWKIVFDPFQKRFMTVIGVIYPFIASLHSILLGVIMTLSPKVFYRPYEKSAPKFGLSALEDQQIAGFIMWMPAGITYALAAITLIILIFNRERSKT